MNNFTEFRTVLKIKVWKHWELRMPSNSWSIWNLELTTISRNGTLTLIKTIQFFITQQNTFCTWTTRIMSAHPKMCLHFEYILLVDFHEVTTVTRKTSSFTILWRSWLKRSNFNEIGGCIDIKTAFRYCYGSVFEVSSNSTVDWFIQYLKIQNRNGQNTNLLIFFLLRKTFS